MAIADIDTLSLHDALPISTCSRSSRSTFPLPTTCSRRSTGCCTRGSSGGRGCASWVSTTSSSSYARRSEEHTSELQSLRHLVCRLLLEKKKRKCFLRRRLG